VLSFVLEQEAPLTLRVQRGRGRNIKGNCKYSGASLVQGHDHFSSGCGFMVGLGKPKLCTKFEVPIASPKYWILKYWSGTSKFWGTPLAQGHVHFSPACDFMMGLGKPQLRAKFEIAGFIHYGNIKEFVFKRQIRFLSHHLGELWELTYGLHLQLVGKRVLDFLFAIIELFSLVLTVETL